MTDDTLLQTLIEQEERLVFRRFTLDVALDLGAHPLAPSSLDSATLDTVLADRPSLLGEASVAEFGNQLPFLMKVLSARHALSIQAHPSREQAEEGYERENAAGIAVDAPERVYSDSWPKPEILIALDLFETLSGFREPVETAALLSALGVAGELGSLMTPLTERKGGAALAQVLDMWRQAGVATALTSWHDGAGTPRPFYERLGFVPTGRLVEGRLP